MENLKRKACIVFVGIINFALNITAQDNTFCYPNPDWLYHDTPEKIGYDPQKIDSIKTYIIEELNTTGLIVVVNGEILFDYGNISELSYIASCRKSLLSILYGKYVEDGTIDLDKTLDELDINDIGGLLPIEKTATIRNLLTARSGIYHPASNGGDQTAHAPERGTVKPGTYFLYNNWDFNAAGGIFENLTNKDIYVAFEQDIALPILMQDFEIENQKKTGDTTKSNYLAYHFWLSTRDMARIGLLMLNKGKWNNEQLVSENWIKLTTSTVTPRSEMNPSFFREAGVEYGYMWWKFNNNNELLDDAYFASGMFGQYLLVIPKLNMVISLKTKSDYERSTSHEDFMILVNKIIDSKI